MKTKKTWLTCQIETDDYIQCICGNHYCTKHQSEDLNQINWAQQFYKQVLDYFHRVIQGHYNILSVLWPIARRIYELQEQCQQQHKVKQIFFQRIQIEGHEGFSNDYSINEEQQEDLIQEAIVLQDLYYEHPNIFNPTFNPNIVSNVDAIVDHDANLETNINPNQNPEIE